ncbi:MAG TPA: hypothetical protein ENI80_01100 [Acidiferrobacteraceae bacterium]|nr:hypothetical protein [Acidiferrobacteraceae bacterium]
MIQEQKFSDEFLNAFIDNQLTPEEKSDAFVAISQDESLNRRVCELRKVRDLVQLACTAPPPPPIHGASERCGLWSRIGFRSIAASILGLGIAIGWVLHTTTPHQIAPTGHQVSALTSPLPAKGIKVLLHLNSGDPERMNELLDEAESLLKFYKKTNQIARVEIITNGGGINLLRADTSPDPARIKRLYRDWNNLAFVACQNTIDRLEREQNINLVLLPEAVVIDSAVAQIMRRQLQGWAYIQV